MEHPNRSLARGRRLGHALSAEVDVCDRLLKGVALEIVKMMCIVIFWRKVLVRILEEGLIFQCIFFAVLIVIVRSTVP